MRTHAAAARRKAAVRIHLEAVKKMPQLNPTSLLLTRRDGNCGHSPESSEGCNLRRFGFSRIRCGWFNAAVRTHAAAARRKAAVRIHLEAVKKMPQLNPTSLLLTRRDGNCGHSPESSEGCNLRRFGFSRIRCGWFNAAVRTHAAAARRRAAVVIHLAAVIKIDVTKSDQPAVSTPGRLVIAVTRQSRATAAT